MRYFDASALVKRYVRETGSTTVRRLLASNTPATSRLTEVEVASALVRLAQEGVFTTAERDRTFVAFDPTGDRGGTSGMSGNPASGSTMIGQLH